MLHEKFAAILVESTSMALSIEKILKTHGTPSKLIPVPRILSSDCGVCVRIDFADKEKVQNIIKTTLLQIEGIYDI
jgi:hypothetical protein